MTWSSFKQDVSVRFILVASLGAALAMVVLVDNFKAENRYTSLLELKGTRVEIEVLNGPFDFPTAEIHKWIKTAYRGIDQYLGQFPVRTLHLQIQCFNGHGIKEGITYPHADGGRIVIHVGRSTAPSEFDCDWTLTHEMVHLGFPSLSPKHRWLEEGLATYVEPWARVRAGALTPLQAWKDFHENLPVGEPQPGEGGLDQSATWARTYWGGALYWFIADITLRSRTKNTLGLESALKGILKAGGNINADWDIDKVLQAGDAATQTTTLQEIYADMGLKAKNIDLDPVWVNLGVIQDPLSILTNFSEKKIRLSDQAPMAAIRMAIESGMGPKRNKTRN